MFHARELETGPSLRACLLLPSSQLPRPPSITTNLLSMPSSQAHRGRNIKSQSIASLLKVVTSLNSFLKRAEGGRASAVAAANSGDPTALTANNKAPVSSVSASAPVGSAESFCPPFTTLMADRTGWYSRRPFLAAFIELTRPGKRTAAAAVDGSPADGGAGAPLSKKALHDLERGVAKPKGKWSVSNKPPGPTTIAKAAAAAALASASASTPGSILSPAAEEGPVMTAATVSDVSGLTQRLIELLFDCWAECGPSNLVGAGASGGGSSGGKALELESLQVLSGILSSASSLLNRLLLINREEKGDAEEGRGKTGTGGTELETLTWASELVIRRVSPHFPATVPSVKPTPVVAEALVQYNLQARVGRGLCWEGVLGGGRVERGLCWG